MKPSAMVAFAVGAALASGIVYVTVKPKPETTPISVENPAITAQPQPLAASPPAEREKPSPLAPPAYREIASQHARKPEKKLETIRVSPPLIARLEPVSQRIQLTTPVKADLPVEPAPPQQVQEAPAPIPAEVHEAAAPIPPPPPAPVANRVTLRAGANLNVRVGETVSTRRSRAGDNFLSTLTDPLVIDGWVIAERGARVEGRVLESDPGGRLSVELVRLTTSDGQRIRIQTEPIDRKARASTGTDGVSAIIGVLTHGRAAEIPVETRLGFRVTSTVEITEQKQR
jgi:hypothetical protein